MAVPNPEFDPEWEEKYERHQTELTRLLDLSFDERTETTQDEIQEHLRITQACLSNYQHKTIQDAARWVFENFDPNVNYGGAEGQVVHDIDFEALRTIEDVTQAWVRSQQISEQEQTSAPAVSESFAAHLRLSGGIKQAVLAEPAVIEDRRHEQ